MHRTNPNPAQVIPNSVKTNPNSVKNAQFGIVQPLVRNPNPARNRAPHPEFGIRTHLVQVLIQIHLYVKALYRVRAQVR